MQPAEKERQRACALRESEEQRRERERLEKGKNTEVGDLVALRSLVVKIGNINVISGSPSILDVPLQVTLLPSRKLKKPHPHGTTLVGEHLQARLTSVSMLLSCLSGGAETGRIDTKY